MKVPWGGILVASQHGGLRSIELWPHGVRVEDPLVAALTRHPNPAVEWIERYLDDPHTEMRLELPAHGTPFQRLVWDSLAGIPVGRVVTYGSLARMLNSGARAVAAACKANPFPILVPCHRVVAVCGLGGYCGHTEGPWLEIKRWLLAHEGYLHGWDG